MLCKIWRSRDLNPKLLTHEAREHFTIGEVKFRHLCDRAGSVAQNYIASVLKCAKTIFGPGGGEQNRERQIDGIFIEFGPRFCSRNKRSLRKKVFAGFGPRFLSRIKCSLKKGHSRLPTAFVWLRIQLSVGEGAQVA